VLVAQLLLLLLFPPLLLLLLLLLLLRLATPCSRQRSTLMHASATHVAAS
jgi:hypothetical protein